MTIKIGINGFGRMGRLGLRAGWDKPDYDIVRINEIATDAKGSAHLFMAPGNTILMSKIIIS